MKKLLPGLYFVILTSLTCDYACATLNVTITVPSPLTPSTTLGIQTALTNIGNQGGGTLTLTGTGSVLVEETYGLQVSANTKLQGDPNLDHQMVLVGENTGGLGYRNEQLITVSGATSNSTTPVVIYHLDFEGGTTGPPARPLCAPAIYILNSSYVQIVYDTIAGSRGYGIAATSTKNLFIEYVGLQMSRKTGSEPEGGFGIWCGALQGVTGSFGCQNAQVTQSNISAVGYFNSGPPSNVGDPRYGTTPPPTAMTITDHRPCPAMALIEFSDGSNNTFDHNGLAWSNAAGIFLFPGVNNTGETGDVIWANQMAYFRQAPLDIDHCFSCDILTNTIATYSEGSIIGLANSTCDTLPGKGVQYNTLDKGGNWLVPGGFQNDYGALQLQGNTDGCTEITNNYIHGGNNPYAVYIFNLYGLPQGNTITNNNLWSGTSGYLSGSPGWNTMNTVSPNTQH